jgi:LacI family transcriptional regulator
MIDDKNLPSVIFATADDMAVGAMNALYDNGYKIPEDVSVVGFYDTKMSSLFRPKLTTIRQPIYDMGAVAIRLLIKLIKGEEVADNMVLLPHELIVRNSCRKID